MVEAVLGGGGLGEVAELAAEAAGAPVAVDRAAAGRRGHLAGRRGPTWRRCAATSPSAAAGGRCPCPPGVAGEAPIAVRRRGRRRRAAARRPGRARTAGEFLQIAALAALTEVAVQGGRAEVERTVRDAFFEELRSRRPPSGEEILRRGASLGCDLRRGAVALCAELSHASARATWPRGSSGEHPGVLAHCLEAAGGRLYALVPAAERPRATVGRRPGGGRRPAPPRARSASRASTASRASSAARSARPSWCSTCCAAARCRSARTSARAPTGCCSASSPRTRTRCARSTRTPSRRWCATTSPTARSWSRRWRRSSSTTARPARRPARSTCTATRSPTGSSA